jgi:uncharacterized membrane-anchored protein YhcB (DUF1043 family)
MDILVIVLAIVVGALAVALFLQMKSAKKQTEDQQQLLKDYEKRVNEQQRLLEDYDSLSKNFDSIGKGYEQALLLFDKMADIRHNLELIAQNDKDPDSVARLEALLKKFDSLQG